MGNNNYGMTPFSGGSLSPAGSFSTSFFEGIKREILELVYHGRYVDARKAMAVEMIKAQNQQKLACIQAMKEIALQVQDDRIREQMFRDIWMFGMQNM